MAITMTADDGTVFGLFTNNGRTYVAAVDEQGFHRQPPSWDMGRDNNEEDLADAVCRHNYNILLAAPRRRGTINGHHAPKPRAERWRGFGVPGDRARNRPGGTGSTKHQHTNTLP